MTKLGYESRLSEFTAQRLNHESTLSLLYIHHSLLQIWKHLSLKNYMFLTVNIFISLTERREHIGKGREAEGYRHQNSQSTYNQEEHLGRYNGRSSILPLPRYSIQHQSGYESAVSHFLSIKSLDWWRAESSHPAEKFNQSSRERCHWQNL